MLVQCAVCGADNDITPAINTPPTGPPDFDTRPGEPLRSTMRQWVGQCSNCGYASDDIAAAPSTVTDVVRSEGYQQALVDPDLPSTALPLYCYSLILERSRQPADSGWAALHAAWACDDAGASEGAGRCRARAIQMWKRGKELGEAFGDDLASEFALVTDVYRRLGEFENAIVACSEGLDIEDAPPAVEHLLRRQIVLIEQRDTDCHSMSELLVEPTVN